MTALERSKQHYRIEQLIFLPGRMLQCITKAQLDQLYRRMCHVTCCIMRQMMPTIGAVIHEKMNWVPATMTIYLVMDNAGGHVTGETVEWYTTELQVRNTVTIHHQCSQSPETNDLGMWMSLQSAIEKPHREQ